jgi:hypothetical protein
MCIAEKSCCGSVTRCNACRFLWLPIANGPCFGQHPNSRDKSARTSEIIVTSWNTEVIDLDAYRQRRAVTARPANASVSPTVQGWTVPAPFFMPLVFFVFWPGWVFSPQFMTAQSEGGHGSV